MKPRTDHRIEKRLKMTRAVYAHLAPLGNSPEAIAQALRERGVRPLRGRRCPLEAYLQPLYPDCPVEVGSAYIWFERAAPVKLPRACRAFLDALDAGAFPDLLAAELTPEVPTEALTVTLAVADEPVLVGAGDPCQEDHS